MQQKVKIAFISVYVAEYKVFLYEALDRLFPGRFYALHGQERPGTRPRDYGCLPIQNNIAVKNKFWVLKSIELIWTPGLWWLLVNKPSVLILGDGVRMISNYFHHLVAKLIGIKIIYYTHGYNHQAALTINTTVQRVSERIRRFLFAHSDALVVYTQANKSYLEAHGIDTRIFVSNNTLDTPKLLARHERVNRETAEELKHSFGAQENQRIIVFLGRLVPEKEVNLFVDVIRELNVLRSSCFFGLVIGDGPLFTDLKEYSQGLPIHFTSHCSGQSLGNHLACADCMFLPSNVGLAVIEAFCAGKPLVTCKARHHGPEIDYVKHGVNGMIVESSNPCDIASVIARMTGNEAVLKRMSHEASATARALHPDASVDAFAEAIEHVSSAGVNAKSAITRDTRSV